jgi:hypothetical protein
MSLREVETIQIVHSQSSCCRPQRRSRHHLQHRRAARVSPTTQLSQVPPEDGEVDSPCESSTKVPSAGLLPDGLLRRTLEGEVQKPCTVASAEVELLAV